MHAVIKTGGKQYRVKAGDVIIIEKLAGEAGDKVAFAEVLSVGDGADLKIGLPLVKGASVQGVLLETRKADKIKIFKKTRRQGYRRTRGHRQWQTVVRIEAVKAA